MLQNIHDKHITTYAGPELFTLSLFSSDKCSRMGTNYSANRAELYQIGPLWDLLTEPCQHGSVQFSASVNASKCAKNVLFMAQELRVFLVGAFDCFFLKVDGQ